VVSQAAAAVIGLYQRHGLAWATLRGDRLPFERRWLDPFLARVPAGGRVLDLGCGSGKPMAAYLLEQGRGVTGVDTAPALLALGQAAFPAEEWVEADMRGLDLGRRFAGVLAWDSCFHLCPEDQRGMFAVFARHAAPGAPLLFTSGPAAGEVLGEFGGETLYHASLDPWEYRHLLATHGFRVLDHVAEDAACGGRTVWLAQLGAACVKA
jgi:SAM-dependent methyltransferase